MIAKFNLQPWYTQVFTQAVPPTRRRRRRNGGQEALTVEATAPGAAHAVGGDAADVLDPATGVASPAATAPESAQIQPGSDDNAPYNYDEEP